MKRARTRGGELAIMLVLLGAAACRPGTDRDGNVSAETSPDNARSTTPASEAEQGFLYGRVITEAGGAYVGRLRFGGDEESFWGDYFNGFKDENPWAAYVPPEQLEVRRSIGILGFDIARWEGQVDLGRPFMVRFGDIAGIEGSGRDLFVTLKSGTIVELDRWAADDFADGVRVWDDRRGVVELVEDRVRMIEFLPTGRVEAAPARLHGTVRTPQGEFTGFLQWNREAGVVTDELEGRTADAELSLRFETIRSIERRSDGGAVVALLDGSEVALSGGRDVGGDNRGIYVNDPRYGRVLISWNALERVGFTAAPTSPTYGDFPPGSPLMGSVTTRDGRRLTGRLVYDLDESETIETLDAPSQGLDYTIPFGLIASIALPGPSEPERGSARVALHSGEELQLARQGDLADGNGGMLIFVEGREGPEYVPWSEVERVELDPPPAMYP